MLLTYNKYISSLFLVKSYLLQYETMRSWHYHTLMIITYAKVLNDDPKRQGHIEKRKKNKTVMPTTIPLYKNPWTRLFTIITYAQVGRTIAAYLHPLPRIGFNDDPKRQGHIKKRRKKRENPTERAERKLTYIERNRLREQKTKGK